MSKFTLADLSELDQLFPSRRRFAAVVGTRIVRPSAVTPAPIFVVTSAGLGVAIRAGAVIAHGGGVRSFAAQTSLSTHVGTALAISGGTDVAVHVSAAGAVSLSTSFTPATGAAIIGGFHWAPGSCASAEAGGNTTAQINPYSIWDLGFRPAAPDPRGMALVAGRFWVDIYFCGNSADLLGTSAFGATIADSFSPPIRPAAFGGNGVNTFAATWFNFAHVGAAAGKEFLDYPEFTAAAYGVTEATDRGGGDPVVTGIDAPRTSRWGIMQATGNQWTWGRGDNIHPGAGGAPNWRANTEGRGSLYLYNDEGLKAPLLGGCWGDGANAGSRASLWNNSPWDSYVYVGARFRCDHVFLS